VCQGYHLAVDDELALIRLPHGQVGRRGALQKAINIGGYPVRHGLEAYPISHETLLHDRHARCAQRRELMRGEARHEGLEGLDKARRG